MLDSLTTEDLKTFCVIVLLAALLLLELDRQFSIRYYKRKLARARASHEVHDEIVENLEEYLAWINEDRRHVRS